MPGIDYISDARQALTWLTHLLSCGGEMHMEFLFADDPFGNLMNIFTFHFTVILFPSVWVLSAFSWLISYCHAKSVQLFWFGWFFYLCVAFVFGYFYLKWSLSALRRYSLPQRMLYWFLYLIFMSSLGVILHAFFEIWMLYVLRKFLWFSKIFSDTPRTKSTITIPFLVP